MKKLLLFVFICCLSGIAITSCDTSNKGGEEDKTDTPATDAVVKTANFPKKGCIEGFCDLSADCSTDSFCTDTDCFTSILECHKLRPGQFDSLINRYHTPAYDGKEIPANELMAHLQAAGNGCKGWRLKIADYSTNETNAEIQVMVEQPVPGDTIEARYTFALFNAVLSLNPQKVQFYKAIHPDGCEDIVFQAIGNDQQPIYTGDVSGLEP